MKPENKANIQRVVRATGYSIQGLKAAYQSEAAFRQEVWCILFLFPLALWLGDDAIEKILLSGSLLIVLIAELLNSAIENVVDRISPDFHELAGRAKDMGSASVFVAMFLTALTWVLILFF